MMLKKQSVKCDFGASTDLIRQQIVIGVYDEETHAFVSSSKANLTAGYGYTSGGRVG